uniref:Uncharacterized protein n=1 Tax=Setaria digitata TaxID=48799 RepID=A0A915Q3M8_9BILA
MHSFYLFPALLLVLLVTICAPSNPTVEWKQDWSEEYPSGASGMHRGWIGISSDHDGGKYVENGWQDSWQSDNDRNFGWDKKRTSGDDWDASAKGKWSWGNGGAQGWGNWGSGYGKGSKSDLYKWSSTGDNDDCCYGADLGGGRSGSGPKRSYTSWGNINTDSWKNSGGGEGWNKWEVDDYGSGGGGHERGGWRGWRSGSGTGNWDSWRNNGKPPSPKVEAYASAFGDP